MVMAKRSIGRKLTATPLLSLTSEDKPYSPANISRIGAESFYRDQRQLSLAFNFRDNFTPACFRIERNGLAFAIFSMHSRHANSSLSGVSRSAAGEMIVPIPRPHCLHVMLSGNDINHAPRATYSALERIWGNRSSMSGWVCTLGKIFVHVSPARNGSRNYALWV